LIIGYLEIPSNKRRYASQAYRRLLPAAHFTACVSLNQNVK